MNNETIRRLRYCKSQLLTAKDFEDQQSYHREKLKRFIERFPQGIVRGLKVICSKPDEGDPEDSESFLIQEGLAIDNDGNLIIVLAQGIRVKVTDFKESSPYLGLVYEEEEVCIRQGCETPVKNNRINEKVKVVWSTLPNTPDQNQNGSIITVAKIEFKSNPAVTDFILNKLADEKKCTEHVIFDEDSSGPVVRLDAGLITEDQIQDGAVTQEKLADDLTFPPSGPAGGDLDESTYPKPIIKDDAITSSKIAEWDEIEGETSVKGIQTKHIQDNAITEDKLDLANITIPPGGDIEDGDLTGSYPHPDIKNGAVTSIKIKEANTDWVDGDDPEEETGINTRHIRDGAVLSAKIAAADPTWVEADNGLENETGINTRHIRDSSITTSKIAGGAVIADKLSFIMEPTGEEGSLVPTQLGGSVTIPNLLGDDFIVATGGIFAMHDITADVEGELLSFRVIPDSEGGPFFWTVGIEKQGSGALKYHLKIENHGNGILATSYIIYKIKMGTIVQ